MADSSLGFRFRFRKSGAPATIQQIRCSATATLSVGDMANLSSGELALGATSNTKFVGLILETKAGTAHTTKYNVIVDADAVYEVYDNAARKKGDTLDISGATGAQTVAASSNKEFVVYATKENNSDPTLVCFNVGKHIDNLAQ